MFPQISWTYSNNLARHSSRPLSMAKDNAMKVRKRKNVGLVKSPIDPYITNLLKNIARGKTLLRLRTNASVFSQGEAADAIYFIQSGKVKITVVSTAGKEAVLAMLGPRGFLGEGDRKSVV